MSASTVTPPYRIETERLVIRCWEPGDAEALKAAVDASKEHLMPWMPWAKLEPQTVEEKISLLRGFRAQFDRDENYIYAVFAKDDRTVLGGSGFHPRVGPRAQEIGYWVHVDHLKKGIASEVASVVTRIGFELLNLIRIEIHCDPANHASMAIPRKLGYTHEVTFRNRIGPMESEPRDMMIWSLFAKDYPKTPASEVRFRAYDAAGREVAL